MEPFIGRYFFGLWRGAGPEVYGGIRIVAHVAEVPASGPPGVFHPEP